MTHQHSNSNSASDLSTPLFQNDDCCSKTNSHSHSNVNLHSDSHKAHSDCGNCADDLPSLSRIVLAVIAAVFAEVLHSLSQKPWDIFVWMGLSLALIAVALTGLNVYRSGWRSLLAWKLDIQALMSVAVTGAFLIGQWPEAAMVMALYALAETIEHRATERASKAIQALLQILPKQAEVLQKDGSWRIQNLTEIALDSVLRVNPGDRIPLDGVLTLGQSALDEAHLTGESLPVDKFQGDALLAGSLNLQASLQMRVTHRFDQSLLSDMVRAVEKAQSEQAPAQRFIDRFARIYTPTVFCIAILLFFFSPWWFGWTWLDAAYRALVLLVVACPCALVISTPVTLVSNLTAAARRGIWIKGGRYLEKARHLKVVALDKTGTLTEGRPKLMAWEIVSQSSDLNEENQRNLDHANHLNNQNQQMNLNDVHDFDNLNNSNDVNNINHLNNQNYLNNQNLIAQKALALAEASNHPISLSIRDGLLSFLEHPSPKLQTSEKLLTTLPKAIAGCGIEAEIDGQLFRLGNRRWMENLGLIFPAQSRQHLEIEAEKGNSLSLLADDQRILAWFSVADPLRSNSLAAIQSLKALEITPVLLTGDHRSSAQSIAKSLSIQEFHAELLPSEKQNRLSELQKIHGTCAMVGDGINDAPALASADLGISLGKNGTGVALETANVIILNDDLGKISDLVKISRFTQHLLLQNLTIALGLKLLFVVLAITGQVTLLMAVIADLGASLLVIANGLRGLKALK